MYTSNNIGSKYVSHKFTKLKGETKIYKNIRLKNTFKFLKIKNI